MKNLLFFLIQCREVQKMKVWYSIENTALLDKTDFPPLQETCQRCKTAVNMRNVMKNCRFWLLLQIKKRSKKEKRLFCRDESLFSKSKDWGFMRTISANIYREINKINLN